MLGPLRAAADRGDAARAHAPNFYFAQEDFIRARSRGKAWTYSTSRPHTFCDAGRARAAQRRAADRGAMRRSRASSALPLDFPGHARQASTRARSSPTCRCSRARSSGWRASRAARTSRTTSPTATPRAGRSCGRGSRSTSASSRRGPRQMRLADYVRGQGGGVAGARRAPRAASRARSRTACCGPTPIIVFAPEWDIISDASKARARRLHETRRQRRRCSSSCSSAFAANKIIP